MITRLFLSFALCSLAVLAAPQFHIDLTDDERQHYFGTTEILEVPEYEYVSPPKIISYDRRRRSSEPGADEALQYLVNAFGESVHVVLEKNRDLQSPGCLVQHKTANGTKAVYPCSTEVNCYYTGHVRNHSDSWVAATVCEGFEGMVHLADKTLVVQPVKDAHVSRARRDTSLTQPHLVYKYTSSRGTCATVEPERDEDDSAAPKAHRRKRSATKKYVETTVVVDPALYKFHGQDTERFVKTSLNVAAERFLGFGMPAQLYFSLIKIVILEHDQAGLRIVPDSDTTLRSFCRWQATWNPDDDKNPQHADYVVLLTRLDLTYQGHTSNTGLGNTAGMCGKTSKCSVNEDIGLGTGMVLAHETGHVLSMSHDHNGNTCEDNRYIMSASAASGPDAFKWSSCSIDSLKKFLATSAASCLNDQPPAQAENLYGASKKPGQIYSANEQCKLMYGESGSLCEGLHLDNRDVCGGIVCRSSPDATCNLSPTPRMDGTWCGGRNWCIQGQCVAMGPGSPGPINGGWTTWEAGFSDCSRTCGGGVKVKRRFCTNPEPQYGGKPCAGSDVIAELCNLQACGKSQYDFMSEQCAATDSEPLQGRRQHWLPSLGAVGDDTCKVFCQADGTNWMSKRGTNVDGTDCFSSHPTTFNKCVAGKCRAFGCDGHVDSGHVFDHCGVCNGGGNTCTKKSGNFHGGKAHMYTTFLTIPKGSTGITITQGNMYCHISVAVNGHRLFSDGSPPQSGTYSYGGVTVKYNSKPEKAEIVGPLSADIQAQVFRKYDPPYVGVDPDIYYEYYVPLGHAQTSTYMWKTQAGQCSKACGTGSQTPVITCINRSSGTVADYFCNINDKPRERSQSCNTQACPPRWRTESWSACTKSCGGGTKHRAVECVQENNNVEKVLAEQSCRGQAKPTSSSQCNTAQCPGAWKPSQWSSCSESCGRGTRTRTVKCYSSASSNTPIADSTCLASQKPTTQEYCITKPCRTDISGSQCKDKEANCFQSYGEGVCNGQYKSWAGSNCMKSCGICVENPSDYDQSCKDVIENCASYTSGFCTNSAYKAWAKSNCKKYCGYCGNSPPTTTVASAVDPNCADTDNCAAYGSNVCTEYASWARTHCKKFCGQCNTNKQQSGGGSTAPCVDMADCTAYGDGICQHTQFAAENCKKHCGLCQGCEDQDADCANYATDMCTKYKPWATAHCQGTCGLCNSGRKKRQAPMIEPPLQGAVPDVEDAPPKEWEDMAPVDIPPKPEVLETAAEVPTRPVCNTVRTASTGSIDIIDKLVPGATCIQTIALPLGSRVLIKFDEMRLDCEEGDELSIADGESGRQVAVCGALLEDAWLSSSSVVELRFRAGQQGHGVSYTYQPYPGNDTVSACSELLTAAVGTVSSHPPLAPAAVCEVTIVGTPGKSIQLAFNSFKMAPEAEGVDGCDGLQVEDLEGGEVDLICGAHAPFVWESRGSRVKLTYKQPAAGLGFDASYSVLDI